jgi:RHS repeat-associated protein
VYSDSAYAPYGEQYAPVNPADPSFTGQNSDTTATLYDFPFREHSPTQGRWISPDPAGLGVVDPTNPQTWNRYGYVMNNPLGFVDPLGLWDSVVCWTDIPPGARIATSETVGEPPYPGGVYIITDKNGDPGTQFIPPWCVAISGPGAYPGAGQSGGQGGGGGGANKGSTPQQQGQDLQCAAQATQVANSEINAKPGAITALTSVVSGLIAAGSGGTGKVGQFLLSFTKAAATSFSIQTGVRATMWGNIYTTQYQICMGEPSTYVPGVTY